MARVLSSYTISPNNLYPPSEKGTHNPKKREGDILQPTLMKRERRTLSVPSIHYQDEVGSSSVIMDSGGFLGTGAGGGGRGGGAGGGAGGVGNGGGNGSAGWPPQQQQQQQHQLPSSNSLSLGQPHQTFNRSRSASTSSLSTPTGATPSSTSGTAKKKVVTACQRCRTRKIRCDGVLPSCKSCVKAGVDCIEVDRSGDNNVPRR